MRRPRFTGRTHDLLFTADDTYRVKYPWWWSKRRRRLEDKLFEANIKVKAQQRALSRIGHARDQAYRDAGKLISDMRIAAFTLDTGSLSRFGDGPIRVMLEFRGEIFLRAFRYDRTFTEAINHELERVLMTDPEVGPMLRRGGAF